MIYRSKAPLRIGLAGGGTDVSPYCDLFGGSVVNATISLYAHAHIRMQEEPIIILESAGTMESFPAGKTIDPEGSLRLLKGVYNAMLRDHAFGERGFRLSTFVDAPAGSGLGTSSTLVVAVIGAFVEMLKIPLGEYDIAHYAFDIERKQLALAGGRQDQFAATFGGLNFMEFRKEGKVIVNPLPVKKNMLPELENNLLLYYTSHSRDSSLIIEEQVRNVQTNNEESIAAMHQLKQQSLFMKEALLKGNLDEVGAILDFGYGQKIKMAHNISTPLLEEIYAAAKSAGATGGKISGAGGGGFMVFYCPGNTRAKVERELEQFGGVVRNYQFVEEGLITWSTDK